MKLNRRKALGGILGGMFAGPEVAKAAIDEGMKIQQLGGTMAGTKALYGDKPYPPAVEQAQNLYDEKSNALRRFNALKDQAMGKFNKYQLEEIDSYNTYKGSKCSEEVHALKSVSQVAKTNIIHERYKKIRIERMKKEALDELRNMAGSNYWITLLGKNLFTEYLNDGQGTNHHSI